MSRESAGADVGRTDGELARHSSADAGRDADAGREDPPTFDEGRYLYCVVLVGDDGDDGAFETEGVEGELVRLVRRGDLGAVVHDCESIYDDTDPGRIRRWLVRHQSVVDDAGERFGTPLPCRFDTILTGGDERVRSWLAREGDALRSALGSLADHWEYRVDVRRTEPVPEAALLASDEDLAALREATAAASDGASFLHEKRYERRLRELRAGRRAAVTEDLVARLDARAREVHELERSPAASLGSATADGDDRDGAVVEPICRLTLLAHEERADAIGAVLDEVAAEPGLEVRFSGPWPPYTFAPEFGGEGGLERPEERENP